MDWHRLNSLNVWRSSVPSERRKWLNAVSNWSDSPAAAFPSYSEIFNDALSENLLFHQFLGGSLNVMPLEIREIRLKDEFVLDGTGPYGYGALFSTSEGPHDNFWTEVRAWSDQVGLVSIVARLPVAPNVPVKWPFDSHQVGRNVVRDLLPWEILWRDFDSKVRKNFNRAISHGLTFEVVNPLNGIEDFLLLYQGTMKRRNAASRFMLDAERLSLLVSELAHRAIMVFVSLDGLRVSTELVLTDGKILQSFLGGTNEDFYELRPNDFLKCELFRWAYDNGYEKYVLGGGLGGDQDGIFRYKKAFAPKGVVPFAVGEWVINPSLYDLLTLQAGESAGHNGWPRYR